MIHVKAAHVSKRRIAKYADTRSLTLAAVKAVRHPHSCRVRLLRVTVSLACLAKDRTMTGS